VCNHEKNKDSVKIENVHFNSNWKNNLLDIVDNNDVIFSESINENEVELDCSIFHDGYQVYVKKNTSNVPLLLKFSLEKKNDKNESNSNSKEFVLIGFGKTSDILLYKMLIEIESTIFLRSNKTKFRIKLIYPTTNSDMPGCASLFGLVGHNSANSNCLRCELGKRKFGRTYYFEKPSKEDIFNQNISIFPNGKFKHVTLLTHYVFSDFYDETGNLKDEDLGILSCFENLHDFYASSGELKLLNRIILNKKFNVYDNDGAAATSKISIGIQKRKRPILIQLFGTVKSQSKSKFAVLDFNTNAATLRDFMEYYAWTFFVPGAIELKEQAKTILACLLIIHKYISKTVESFKPDQLNHLKNVILWYYELLESNRFYNLFTAKHHKLVHLPLDIYYFGNVKNLDSFSLELNQGVFRRLTKSNHIKDIPMEIQKKYQYSSNNESIAKIRREF